MMVSLAPLADNPHWTSAQYKTGSFLQRADNPAYRIDERTRATGGDVICIFRSTFGPTLSPHPHRPAEVANTCSSGSPWALSGNDLTVQASHPAGPLSAEPDSLVHPARVSTDSYRGANDTRSGSRFGLHETNSARLNWLIADEQTIPTYSVGSSGKACWGTSVNRISSETRGPAER